MIKRRYALVLALAFCLTATLFIVSSIGYDPWVDYDEDGYVGPSDFAKFAGEYGTSGDPTKNVSVVNWPVSTAVTIWYDEPLTYPAILWSDNVNASGFGHIHLLMHGGGLSGGEELRINLYGLLYNPTHTAYIYIPIGDTVTLTSTSTHFAISMPVPCEEIAFAAFTSSGTTCDVDLSYYLTWA